MADTWLVQALSDTAALGELRLTLGPDNRLRALDGRLHALWSDRYPPDPAVQQLVDRLRAPHRAMLEAPIATAAERIGRQYRSESPFDALVGDILRAETGAEIALLPGVGYGVSLEPGPITREALATLLPHPTKVATVLLTGAKVREALEQSARNQQPDDPMDRVGGLLQSSGMRWTVDLGQPAGARIRDLRVGDAPIADGRSYRVVTNASMLQGLHRYRIGEGRDPQVLDRSVTAVVEAAMQRLGTVRAPRPGNVTLLGVQAR